VVVLSVDKEAFSSIEVGKDVLPFCAVAGFLLVYFQKLVRTIPTRGINFRVAFRGMTRAGWWDRVGELVAAMSWGPMLIPVVSVVRGLTAPH
jgi:hypothetical protein